VFAMTLNEGLADKVKLEAETIATIMPLAKDASLQKAFFAFLNSITLTGKVLRWRGVLNGRWMAAMHYHRKTQRDARWCPQEPVGSAGFVFRLAASQLGHARYFDDFNILNNLWIVDPASAKAGEIKAHVKDNIARILTIASEGLKSPDENVHQQSAQIVMLAMKSMSIEFDLISYIQPNSCRSMISSPRLACKSSNKWAPATAQNTTSNFYSLP
jgi:hypothetical protein